VSADSIPNLHFALVKRSEGEGGGREEGGRGREGERGGGKGREGGREEVVDFYLQMAKVLNRWSCIVLSVPC
jgi:hypothetical protein